MITVQQSSISYVGDGSAVTYVFPFRVLEPVHLQVRSLNELGIVTVLTLGDDFTVELLPEGGTITLTEAIPVGHTLRVYRVTPKTQLVDLTPGGEFKAESVETALDKAIMALQEMSAGNVEASDPSGFYASIYEERIARADADSAFADRLLTIEAYLGDPDSEVGSSVFARIHQEQAARVAADSAQALTIADHTAWLGAPSDELGESIFARVHQETEARASADAALSQTSSELNAKVGNIGDTVGTSIFSRLYQEQQARATADSTNASSIANLSSTVGLVTDPTGGGTLFSRINRLTSDLATEQSTRASADSTQSSNLTTLSSKIGTIGDLDGDSLYARINQEMLTRADADGRLLGKYVLTATAGGRVASMSLVADSDPAGWGSSSVSFLADSFKIYNGVTDVAPFSVSEGNTSINGALLVNGRSLETIASNAAFPSVNFVGSGTPLPVNPAAYPINSLFYNTADSSTYIRTNAGTWALYAAGGTPGVAGPIGETGATGPSGEDGADGEAGPRGSRAFYGSASAWVDGTADATITAFGFTKVALDQVTLSNGTSWAETRFWSGSAWTAISAVINGNLLVNGTVGTDKLVARSITADKIVANVGLDAPVIRGGSLTLASDDDEHSVHMDTSEGGIRINGGQSANTTSTDYGAQLDLRGVTGIEATADLRGAAVLTAADLGGQTFVRNNYDYAGEAVLRAKGVTAGTWGAYVRARRDGSVVMSGPSIPNGFSLDIVGNSLVVNFLDGSYKYVGLVTP